MWPWTGSRDGSGSGSDARRPPGLAAAGFTLIEVLIAFVILALALGALLPGFSAGLRGLDVADDHATAALLAESRLAAVGREAPLEEGTTSGVFDDDRFRWRLDVTALPEADPEGVLPVLPYAIALTVSWGEGDGRAVVVETLRLGPPPRLRLAR